MPLKDNIKRVLREAQLLFTQGVYLTFWVRQAGFDNKVLINRSKDIEDLSTNKMKNSRFPMPQSRKTIYRIQPSLNEEPQYLIFGFWLKIVTGQTFGTWLKKVIHAEIAKAQRSPEWETAKNIYLKARRSNLEEIRDVFHKSRKDFIDDLDSKPLESVPDMDPAIKAYLESDDED